MIPGQEDPWRKKWQPTPLFLLGEFHGQRSLVGYSPWGCKESDTTEQLKKIYIYIKLLKICLKVKFLKTEEFISVLGEEFCYQSLKKKKNME